MDMNSVITNAYGATGGLELNSNPKLGKTVGEPKLSQEATKYYESLKKKYGNYDFVLVSEDQKEYAKANAGRFANPYKTAVLIDEEKIERMATDTKFRKQYEDILSGASTQLQQLKAGIEKTGANVQGYGIQVNDGGTLSFFAVLKKSTAEQKVRIEKAAEKRKAERKTAERRAAEKKKAEKAAEKVAESKKAEKTAEAKETDTVTISADSAEDLLRRISDHVWEQRSNSVQTDSEMKIGQNIDFRG